MAQKLAIIDRITELSDMMSKHLFSHDELFSYIKNHPRTLITRDRRTAKKSKDRLVFFNTSKKGDGSAVIKSRIANTLKELLNDGKIFVHAKDKYSLKPPRTPHKVEVQSSDAQAASTVETIAASTTTARTPSVFGTVRTKSKKKR